MQLVIRGQGAAWTSILCCHRKAILIAALEKASREERTGNTQREKRNSGKQRMYKESNNDIREHLP